MLNGDPVVFITVGGRTSAIVPTVQQKTGNAAKGAADDPGATPSKGRSKAVTKIVRKKVATSTKKPVLKTEEQDGNEGDEDSVPKTPLRKRKAAAAAYKQTENAAGTSPAKKSKTRGKTETTEPTVPLRRGRSATAKK